LNTRLNSLKKILILISSIGIIFFSFAAFCGELRTSEELAGEKIFRQGILPTGKAITAIVAGDIKISGKQFSCSNCHGRSGMGTIEGNYIVPPIAGKLLFVDANQPIRSAYNSITLAKLLREGINPDGKRLDPLMPRFIISDQEVDVLVDYLKKLSNQTAPGIDKKTIRLATVISDKVDKDRALAVQAVLQKFVDEKNRQTRLESQRPNRGKRPELRSASLFRDWALDIWRLKGEPSSWNEQLENYYKKQPVFALLGGMTTHSWQPIGQFCESNKIPCMFPSVNLTGASKDDFYTYHFSRGIELEADVIANYLVNNHSTKVVQVYCKGSAKDAATRLSLILNRRSIAQKFLAIDCKKLVSDSLTNDKIVTPIKFDKESDLVLWMGQKKLKLLLSTTFIAKNSHNRIFLSSTLMNRTFSSLANIKQSNILVAHPFKLPGKFDSAFRRFQIWAKLRKIKVTHPRYQAEAFFACLATKDALNHVRRYRVRDYFLDVIDHSQGLELYLPFYPQPSLGPKQRFLSKSGYIVPLVDGKLDVIKAELIEP